MTAKDRFCGEWGTVFPQWPLPVWASKWPENEEDVHQLVEQCAIRVTQLETELERERFSLEFLSSFNERQRASLNHSSFQITSEDVQRKVDQASGLGDMETIVNRTTSEPELNEELRHATPYTEPVNESVENTRNSEEGGMTLENDTHNSEAPIDIGDNTVTRRHTLSRKGAFRRSPDSSPQMSPALSPRPCPRSGSAFPVASGRDPENRRRSSSTGNLPSRTQLDVISKATIQSADSSPTTQVGPASPVILCRDDKEEMKDAVNAETDKEERRDSKGHRPRSMNLGSKAGIRDTLRQKKLSASQSDSILPFSLSTKSVVDERLAETTDSNVILVLPENAILASPSEDIFSQNGRHKEDLLSDNREEGLAGLVNLSDKGMELVNLTSPDHIQEVTIRAADMNKRESCFLDLSDTDGTLPREGRDTYKHSTHLPVSEQSSNQSVQLDEVSMAIYDDCDDDFLDSDDGEYSSDSENEEKEDSVFRENGQRQEENGAEEEDIREELHREMQGEENEDGTCESPTGDGVVRRRRPRGSPSPRRTGGISPHAWKELQGEMAEDPQLAEFCQSQLLAMNKEEEEAEPDVSTPHPVCKVSVSMF